jgi:lipopolysaccharide exporter
MIERLKAQVISGVKWGGVSTGVSVVLEFITLAVLARLLTPSDFGLMGMVMVVIAFLQLFSDMGLSNALIHRQDIKECHFSSFFWANILSGIVLFLVVLLIRPLVVMYFKEPRLSNYLIFAAFLMLIIPGNQMFITLLKKELRFKTLSKVEILSTSIYSISAIGLALAKFGVLSLILGQLARSLFTLGIFFIIFWKTWLPKFHFSYEEIKDSLSFGAFQLGERTVNYFRANVDYIIIGHFLGATQFGFYVLAFQIIAFPMTRISPIISRVAFPAFSKVQTDNSLIRAGYCKILKYVSMVTFPMMVGMFAVAPEFIKLVYGPKWEPSIIVLQILCLVGLFWSVGTLVGSVLLAKGRADIGFYWNSFVVLVKTIVLIIAVNWGIVGIAVAILLLRAPFFTGMQSIVNRLIDLKFAQYFKAVGSSFICSIIMLVGIFLIRLIFKDTDKLFLLPVCVIAGTIIYFVSYFIKDKEGFLEAKSMLLKSAESP